jgi:lysophospholipase L1-like esterase
VLGALVAVTLVAPSCGLLGGDGDQRVAIVGDSITKLAADNLTRRDPDGYVFTIEAINSNTSGDLLDEAAEAAHPPPDQVIINVGTNDVGGAIPPEETMDHIRTMIDGFPDADCIHVTTVNEQIISFEEPEIADRAATLNDRIRALPDDDARITVVDWSEEVEHYLEIGEPDGPLTIDTVHPTGVGQRMLTNLYLDALDACG